MTIKYMLLFHLEALCLSQYTQNGGENYNII